MRDYVGKKGDLSLGVRIKNQITPNNDVQVTHAIVLRHGGSALWLTRGFAPNRYLFWPRRFARKTVEIRSVLSWVFVCARSSVDLPVDSASRRRRTPHARGSSKAKILDRYTRSHIVVVTIIITVTAFGLMTRGPRTVCTYTHNIIVSSRTRDYSLCSNNRRGKSSSSGVHRNLGPPLVVSIRIRESTEHTLMNVYSVHSRLAAALYDMHNA